MTVRFLRFSYRFNNCTLLPRFPGKMGLGSNESLRITLFIPSTFIKDCKDGGFRKFGYVQIIQVTRPRGFLGIQFQKHPICWRIPRTPVSDAMLRCFALAPDGRIRLQMALGHWGYSQAAGHRRTRFQKGS